MKARRLKQAFFSSLADSSQVTQIFEHVPDIFFFVKDLESRLITGSRNMIERLGLKSELDLIGTADRDYFPEPFCDAFRGDDLIVFKSGKALIDRLEVWYDETRTWNWFKTTKVPLFGKDGKVIGLMGITRRDISRDKRESDSELNKIMSHVNANVGRVLSTAELAQRCGLSERGLQRKVKEQLGVTPYELMLRTRIQKASEALLTRQDAIIQIALDFGFCDQSTFTQHFKKRMGMTPRAFRLCNKQRVTLGRLFPGYL